MASDGGSGGSSGGGGGGGGGGTDTALGYLSTEEEPFVELVDGDEPPLVPPSGLSQSCGGLPWLSSALSGLAGEYDLVRQVWLPPCASQRATSPQGPLPGAPGPLLLQWVVETGEAWLLCAGSGAQVSRARPVPPCVSWQDVVCPETGALWGFEPDEPRRLHVQDAVTGEEERGDHDWTLVPRDLSYRFVTGWLAGGRMATVGESAAGAETTTLRLLDARTLQWTSAPLEIPVPLDTTQFVVSRDRRMLAVPRSDGAIGVYDVREGDDVRLVVRLGGVAMPRPPGGWQNSTWVSMLGEGELNSDFSPDSTRLAVLLPRPGRRDGRRRRVAWDTCAVWDLGSGAQVFHVVLRRDAWLRGWWPDTAEVLSAVAWSPDGRLLAVAAEWRLRVLDARTGREVRPPLVLPRFSDNGAARHTSVRWSPCGALVTFDDFNYPATLAVVDPFRESAEAGDEVQRVLVALGALPEAIARLVVRPYVCRERARPRQPL
jgi:hypothetical protein